MLYSFDVFDTLITRKTASPVGVFLLMKNKLRCSQKISNEYVVSNFVGLRIKSEKNAILFADSGEITFDEIYSVFKKMTQLDDECIEILKQLELDTEKELAVGIDPNIKRIHDLQEANDNVVLISDMYFSKKQLKEIIGKIDEKIASLPIFVSSEYKASKNNGMLYKKIREILNIDYKDWTHCGDNQYSDVSVPSLLGIKSVHYKKKERLPWENKLLSKFNLFDNLQLHLYLFASERLRMQNNLSDSALPGLSFGGVILFNYVKWIVDTSIQSGFNRLYFVSRDGFVLQKIAEIYIDEFNLDLKTKYVYGSRTAWRVDAPAEREAVKKYLEQECDFSDNKYAFVDVQGTGISFSYLADILFDSLGHILNVFYYTMAKCPDLKNCNFIIFSGHDDTNLIEPLCRAPHGAVLGYKREKNSYVPLLAEIDKTLWNKCGLDDFNEAVCLYSKELCRLLREIRFDYDYFSFNDALLAYSRQEPDGIIVNYFSRLYHNDSNENEITEYAPSLSRKQLFDIFMWRTEEPVSDYYNGFSFDYSLRRMSDSDKKLVEFYQKNYSGFLGKTIHFYKYLKTKWNPTILFKSKKSRVVLYAAGKCGQEMYRKFKHSVRFRLIGWTDINYEKLLGQGLNLMPVNDVFKIDFDIIIIAIKNSVTCEGARNMLVSLGIPKEKILTYSEFNKLY